MILPCAHELTPYTRTRLFDDVSLVVLENLGALELVFVAIGDRDSALGKSVRLLQKGFPHRSSHPAIAQFGSGEGQKQIAGGGGD